MNKHSIILICLSIFLFGKNLYAQSEQIVFVSMSGSDKNPGTIEKPFATPEKAFETIKKARQIQTEASFTVFFREGTYFRKNSLELLTEISGKESAPFIIRNYENEKVVFHGGKRIDGSKAKLTTNKSVLSRLLPEVQGKVWEINLKKQGVTDYGTMKKHGFGSPVDVAPIELFIDGEPQWLARYPNKGEDHLAIGKIYDGGSIPRDGDYSNRGGEFGFEYDRPERWKQADEIWIHGKFSYGFNDDHLKIDKIDYEKRSIKVTSPHLYGLRTSTQKYIDPENSMDLSGLNVRGYYAYNLIEEVDEPGEYYLDRKTGKLYIYNTADLSDVNIEVSLIELPFISIVNGANITIEGINFTCTRGQGIYLQNCSDITINECVFSNMGTVGISMGQQLRNIQQAYLADGSPKQEYPKPGDFKNITISSCKIFNTGTGGVIMNGGNRKKLIAGNNMIVNTEFYVNERINQTYSPSVRLYGVGNIIRNCYFHDLDHQAIGFMGNDHLIEYCRFDKVCTDADDMGPIYTGRNPSARGTVIQYNYFSNILPQHNDTKMCGVYFDDGSGGMTVKNNFFYKVGNPGKNGGYGAVYFHGGHGNVVDGNIFMDCTVAVGHHPWDDKRWAESLKKPLQQKLLTEEVDIMGDVYQERYPELKNYFTDFGKRLNYVRNNLFIRSQSVQRGNYALAHNLTNNNCGDTPESIDYSKVQHFLTNMKPFPFDKVGIHNK